MDSHKLTGIEGIVAVIQSIGTKMRFQRVMKANAFSLGEWRGITPYISQAYLAKIFYHPVTYS